MATSVQSLHTAAPRPQTLKSSAKQPQSDRSFASTFHVQLAQDSANQGTSTSLNTKFIGSSTLFEIDPERMGGSLADVMMQVVIPRSTPAARKPIEMKPPETAAKTQEVAKTQAEEARAETVRAKVQKMREIETRYDRSADASRSAEEPVMAQVLSHHDVQALRLRFPFVLTPEVLTTSGVENSAEAVALASYAAMDAVGEVANGNPITADTLVFQLTMEVPGQGTAIEPPANVDRPAKQAVQPGGSESLDVLSILRDREETRISVSPANATMKDPQGQEQAEPRPLPPATDALVRETVAPSPQTVIPASVQPIASRSETPTGTPRPAVARNAEPAALTPKPLATTLLQKIGIVVHGTGQSVRLDIRQNMGQVRVSVHSDDTALAARLRDSLPELLSRLDDQGLEARVSSMLNTPTMAPEKTLTGGDAKQSPESWTQDPTERQEQQKHSHRQRRVLDWELQQELLS
ncbi:MAG: hypothetical protein ABI811_19005 [Acidobacteriota bacterium]